MRSNPNNYSEKPAIPNHRQFVVEEDVSPTVLPAGVSWISPRTGLLKSGGTLFSGNAILPTAIILQSGDRISPLTTEIRHPVCENFA